MVRRLRPDYNIPSCMQEAGRGASPVRHGDLSVGLHLGTLARIIIQSLMQVRRGRALYVQVIRMQGSAPT